MFTHEYLCRGKNLSDIHNSIRHVKNHHVYDTNVAPIFVEAYFLIKPRHNCLCLSINQIMFKHNWLCRGKIVTFMTHMKRHIMFKHNSIDIAAA